MAPVNSAALKAAGITKDTLDPQGGVIEHDHSGEPTGVLKDTAMELLAGLLPKDPPDIDMRAAKLISEKAAEVGLTTLHDIFISSTVCAVIRMHTHEAWLKIRVQMSPQIGSIADAERRRTWRAHGLAMTA